MLTRDQVKRCFQGAKQGAENVSRRPGGIVTLGPVTPVGVKTHAQPWDCQTAETFHTWGDFTEYIPLVPGGHRKNSLFFINVLLKMTKCYESYMEKVIRKHTRQAPRQFIGPLRLWSP